MAWRENSKTPTKIIEQAEEALEWAVEHRITRCKEDFEQKYQNPKKRAQVLEESKEFRYWNCPEHLQLAGDALEAHECPACSATGMLSGNLWEEEVSDDVDPDDPLPNGWIRHTLSTNSCAQHVRFICLVRTRHEPLDFGKNLENRKSESELSGPNT